MSASTTPARSTEGTSSPLATICVPTSTSASPSANARSSRSCAPLPEAVSLSQRSTRACGGQACHLVSHALRAQSEVADMDAPAPGTASRLHPCPAAVMAAQSSAAARCAVIRKGSGASRAAHHEPAAAARDDAGRTSPVEEEHSLTACRECVLQSLLQQAAEYAAVPLPQLRSHVNDVHLRECGRRAGRLDTGRHRQVPDRALPCAPRGHNVRRRAAQDDDGAR